MRKLLPVLICIVPIACCQLVFSQQSTVVSASAFSVDTSRIDTNYLKFYKDKLILALWQSERRFDITISQKMFPDSGMSTINYIANANQVSGISLDYDILSLAFGYRSVPSVDKRKGNTDYLDLGLNINTSGFRFENSYRRYTGFYDNNTTKYIHPFTDSTPYFQNPNMNISQVKSKLIYTISHKRFSLSGAYANVKRQVKSAGSVLLVYNFYGLSMYSDSSIIPPPLQNFYGPIWDGFNKMNIYAYSAGAGYTRTFVFWKKFYFNFLFALGYERQYRHYYIYPENVQYSYWKTWFAGDWRTSVGWNGKRFFIRATSTYDLNNYESTALNFKMKFFAGSFDLGWRFKFRVPKPYRKFQETKVYKML
ncbi:MAG: DUF4421 family protein [Bacteroidetes bacterium]|nr:DUF4421 family protein [Bacteroidota bacterium]